MQWAHALIVFGWLTATQPVALALNRADWLAAMNYTLAEAIDRAGPVWISLLPRVVRALDNDA